MAAADLWLKHRDADKAIENWARVTRLQADNLRAHSRLAVVYERLGRKSQAVREFISMAALLQDVGQIGEALKAIDNCWVYLNAHRGRTYYGKYRRGGYPLGSGGMESSNKFICHVRLKRSGAWWYEVNSNQMLALRCAKYNGTFDQVFARYQHQKSDA